MRTRLPREELQALQLRNVDDVGRVVVWRGRLLRIIRNERGGQTQRLLASGLLAQLAAAGLLVETTVTDLQLDDADLILEHRRLMPLTFPHEWSFSMLHDAALTILAVADAALAAGWNMKDGHAHNLVFDGLEPRYVDVGSFMPAESRAWRPYLQFLRSFYYPLMLWASHPLLARLSQLADGTLQHRDYLLMRRPWLRRLPLRVQQAAESILISSARPHTAADRADLQGLKRRLRLLLGVESLDPAGVRRRLRALRPPPPQTAEVPAAGDPAAALSAAGISGGTVLLPDSVAPAAVQAIVQRLPQLRVICCDCDEDAVDRSYVQLRRDPLARRQVSLAVTDLLKPLENSACHRLAQRIAADTVFVSAEVLQRRRQRGYTLSVLLEQLARFAGQRLLVELEPPDAGELTSVSTVRELRRLTVGGRTLIEFSGLQPTAASAEGRPAAWSPAAGSD
jgi:hypothetical protein